MRPREGPGKGAIMNGDGFFCNDELVECTVQGRYRKTGYGLDNVLVTYMGGVDMVHIDSNAKVRRVEAKPDTAVSSSCGGRASLPLDAGVQIIATVREGRDFVTYVLRSRNFDGRLVWLKQGTEVEVQVRDIWHWRRVYASLEVGRGVYENPNQGPALPTQPGAKIVAQTLLGPEVLTYRPGRALAGWYSAAGVRYTPDFIINWYEIDIHTGAPLK
jgi:hypothetical protein